MKQAPWIFVFLNSLLRNFLHSEDFFLQKHRSKAICRGVSEINEPQEVKSYCKLFQMACLMWAPPVDVVITIINFFIHVFFQDKKMRYNYTAWRKICRWTFRKSSYWEKNHVKDYVIETDQNDSENDFEIRVQIKKRGIVSTKYSMYNI
jgi:hypothetical protein